MSNGAMDPVERHLLSRGFVRTERGFRGRGMVVTPEFGWLRFEAPAREVVPEAPRPGLWKNCGDGLEAADLPMLEAEAEIRGRTLLEAGIDWLLNAYEGIPLAEWQPPSIENLAEWLPPAVRSLRHHDTARGVEIDRGEARLALHVVMAHPGEDLAGAQVFRMVRIRRTPTGHLAEIDLTGAPEEILEPLLRASADCLNAALPWLLVLELRRDPAAASVPPSRRQATAGISPQII